jgi:hypothetical protein
LKGNEKMTLRTNASPNKMTLLALVGGAALGAAVVALTTPKTGREVRNALKNSARRLGGKTIEPDEPDTGTMEAMFI